MNKLFLITIDNNPGEWKDGSDPTFLIIGKNEDDVIEKIKNGWKYVYQDKKLIVGMNYHTKGITRDIYISKNADLYVEEIFFSEHHLKIDDRESIINELIKEK